MSDTRLQHVSGAERETLLARIRQGLVARGTDEEIAADLGLNQPTYEALRDELYLREESALRRATPEKHYLDFVMGSSQDIRDLTRLLGMVTAEVEVGDTGQKQTIVLDSKAFVAAIKARNDIRSKLIEQGQGLGIIRKAPERRVLYIEGKPVQDMDERDLRKALVEQGREIDTTMGAYAGDILEGELVDEPSAAPPAAPGDIEKPTFSEDGAPKFARGGLAKTSGARAVNR